jgi:hypothetical protein
MHSQASLQPDPNTAPDDLTDEDYIIVWEGMLTKFVTADMNLSVPYYTFMTRAMKKMGCIRQLRRGGGTSPSQWQLVREPTEADFTKYSSETLDANHITPRKRQSMQEELRDQIANLNNRLSVVERALTFIIEEQEGE